MHQAFHFYKMGYNFIRIRVEATCRRIKCVVWVGESESIKKLEFSFKKLVHQRFFCVQSILGAAKSNAPNSTFPSKTQNYRPKCTQIEQTTLK